MVRAGARGPRTRAERDAVTVEITFALFSAAVLAGLVFLAVAAPALFGDGSDAWLTNGQWAGSSVFVLRVLWVLLRWQQHRRPDRAGRTGPDA